MSGTARPSEPSTSSPAERTIPVFRVSIYGFEGAEVFTTSEEPPFWQHLVSTGALPDWLVFQTVSGTKVAMREESIQHVEVDREVGVDLDAVAPEPSKKGPKKKVRNIASTDSFD